MFRYLLARFLSCLAVLGNDTSPPIKHTIVTKKCSEWNSFRKLLFEFWNVLLCSPTYCTLLRKTTTYNFLWSSTCSVWKVSKTIYFGYWQNSNNILIKPPLHLQQFPICRRSKSSWKIQYWLLLKRDFNNKKTCIYSWTIRSKIKHSIQILSRLK